MAFEDRDWVSVDDAILAHQQGIANYGGSLDYERLKAVRFVEGVAGGTIDYDGAREWVAARLTEGDPQG
jgi:hypothetical protein